MCPASRSADAFWNLRLSCCVRAESSALWPLAQFANWDHVRTTAQTEELAQLRKLTANILTPPVHRLPLPTPIRKRAEDTFDALRPQDTPSSKASTRTESAADRKGHHAWSRFHRSSNW